MFSRIIVVIFRFILIMVSIIITLAIGGYVAFLTYQTIFYIPNVNVHSVLNMDIKNSQNILHQTGLKMSIIDKPFLNNGDNLFIITQNPPPGSEVKKNRTVEVEVAQTIASERVPDLIGRTVQEAELLLDNSGYRIGNIAYSMHHQLSQGKIIAQTPNPGENSDNNKEIHVLVSKGLY